MDNSDKKYKDIKKYSHYYKVLTKEEKEAYMKIREALLNKTKEVTVKIDCSRIKTIMRSIQYDNPQFFYFNWKYSYLDINNIYTGKKTRLFFSYGTDSIADVGELEKIEEDCDKQIRKIVKNVTATSDYDRVVKIHDILARNIEYENNNGHNVHEIREALLRKKGVCESYAKLMKMCCDYFEIPSIIVLNKDHAWNMVKINGEWTHIDVTFDRVKCDENRLVSHRHFGLTDKEISKSREYDRSIYNYPKCDSRINNYYSVKKLVFTNVDDITKYAIKNARFYFDTKEALDKKYGDYRKAKKFIPDYIDVKLDENCELYKVMMKDKNQFIKQISKVFWQAKEKEERLKKTSDEFRILSYPECIIMKFA